MSEQPPNPDMEKYARPHNSEEVNEQYQESKRLAQEDEQDLEAS